MLGVLSSVRLPPPEHISRIRLIIKHCHEFFACAGTLSHYQLVTRD